MKHFLTIAMGDYACYIKLKAILPLKSNNKENDL